MEGEHICLTEGYYGNFEDLFIWSGIIRSNIKINKSVTKPLTLVAQWSQLEWILSNEKPARILINGSINFPES